MHSRRLQDCDHFHPVTALCPASCIEFVDTLTVCMLVNANGTTGVWLRVSARENVTPSPAPPQIAGKKENAFSVVSQVHESPGPGAVHAGDVSSNFTSVLMSPMIYHWAVNGCLRSFLRRVQQYVSFESRSHRFTRSCFESPKSTMRMICGSDLSTIHSRD